MIPDGWEIRKIEECGKVQSGRQRAPQFTKGEIRPYLRVANVFDGFIDTSDVREMPFTDSEYKIYLLKEEDILLNEGQTIELVGRAAIYNGQPIDCCFQNTLIRFRAYENTNFKFAFSLFQYLFYTGQFSSIAARTTSIAHLGVSRFANYKAYFPPLLEQCKIAEILGAWDESIDLLERLIGKTRSRKQGLMQQLLTGKKRFKEFEGSEWKKVSIGEIAFVDKRSLNNNTPKDYTFFYVSLSNIDNGHISNNLKELCFEQAPSRARRLVSNNDILMATVRPNLKSFAIVKTNADK